MGSELTAGQKALLERHTRRGGPGECWPWCGPVAKGLPTLRVKEGGAEPKLSAVKAAYQVHVGPVAAGRYVLPRCGNRLCVNPGHLYLSTAPFVTRAEEGHCAAEAARPRLCPVTDSATASGGGFPDLAEAMARLTRADVPALDAQIAALDARRAALSYLRSYAQSRPEPTVRAEVRAPAPARKTAPKKKPAPAPAKRPTGSPLARRIAYFVAAQGATEVAVLAKALSTTPAAVFAAVPGCPWLARNGDRITATPAGVALALEGGA